MNNTTTNRICTVFQNGEWKRGEYTGYSELTKKHHVSLYNGDTIALSSLAGVKFDTVEPTKELFETGATSHAVNDLILFTDNTRELAELRDDIYKMMWQFDLMGDVKTWNNERFQKLLNKARAAYSNEFGGDNSLHIINMTDAEKIEYRQLYMNDFENWKSEHGYK